MSDLKKYGEFGLIDRFRSRLQYRSPRIKIGIGDDCAVYESATGNYQIITTDALIENVHFKLSTTPPNLLGRKALSVNVSDIAAMGGTPHLAFISLGIPKSFPIKFLDDLYKGINQVCMEHKIELAGGDTTASPRHLFINITMVGDVSKKHLILRSGARPGDKIFVTGAPGQSALGLKLLTSRRKKWQGNPKFQKRMIQAHLDPVPRLSEAGKLVNSRIKITSMIDVSDGLVQDLFHICESGVGAALKEEWLPQSSEMTEFCSLNRLNAMDLILSGGEDYELLFTLKPEDARKIEKLFHDAKTPVTQIGEVSAQPEKMVLVKKDGTIKPLQEFMGFNHFKSKEPLFPR